MPGRRRRTPAARAAARPRVQAMISTANIRKKPEYSTACHGVKNVSSVGRKTCAQASSQKPPMSQPEAAATAQSNALAEPADPATAAGASSCAGRMATCAVMMHLSGHVENQHQATAALLLAAGVGRAAESTAPNRSAWESPQPSSRALQDEYASQSGRVSGVPTRVPRPTGSARNVPNSTLTVAIRNSSARPSAPSH
jgi:hypothetical protein